MCAFSLTALLAICFVYTLEVKMCEGLSGNALLVGDGGGGGGAKHNRGGGGDASGSVGSVRLCGNFFKILSARDGIYGK